MYIDDFDDFDDFQEFEESTEFQYLDDFRGNNTFRDFDDTEEINEPNRNSFMCPAVCPFYRQFYEQSYRQITPPPGYGGARQMDRPPSGPPPSQSPVEPFSAAGGPQTFVDAGSIIGCRFKFVYIWPRRGRSFWMWLTFVGRRSISGWRWDGRRWFRFGMDLREIRSFRC